MSGADFLDSNLLIYLVDQSAGDKSSIAREHVARALAEQSAVISFQVVQETLHVIGRKFKSTVTPADQRALLAEVLWPLCTVAPSLALYDKALTLQARLGYALYDSLIVAAALEAGCKRLLSEDLQHGQKIEGLRIENPFRAVRG